MIDTITNLIALLTIITGISGIFAISETINNEESAIYSVDGENNFGKNDENSVITNVHDNTKSFSDTKNVSLSIKDIDNNNYDLILYPSHGTILSNQYLQSTKNNHIEGERAPPITV